MTTAIGGSGRSAGKRSIKGGSLGDECEAVASGVERVLELPCVARADWGVLACDALAPSFGAVAVAIADVSASGEVQKVESFGARGLRLDSARRMFMSRQLPEIDDSEVMVWKDDSEATRGALGPGSWWAQSTLGKGPRRLLVCGSSDLQNIGLVMELVVARLAVRADLAFGDRFTSCLTACEVRVLELLVEGRTVREIATVICRSPHTVHDHVKRLHRKLEATSRGELISRALGRRTDFPCMECA